MNKIINLLKYLKINNFSKEARVLERVAPAGLQSVMSNAKRYNIDMKNLPTGGIIRLVLNIVNDQNKVGNLSVQLIKGSGNSKEILKQKKYSNQQISDITANLPSYAKSMFSIADYLSMEARGPAGNAGYHNYFMLTKTSIDNIKKIIKDIANAEFFLNLRPDNTSSNDSLSDIKQSVNEYRFVDARPELLPSDEVFGPDEIAEELSFLTPSDPSDMLRDPFAEDTFSQKEETLDIEIPDVGMEQYQFRGHGTKDAIPEYERKKKKMKFRGDGLSEVEDDSIKTEVPSDEFFEQMDKDDKLRQSLIGKRVQNWATIDDIEIENGVVKSVNITLLGKDYKDNPKRKYTGGKGLSGTVEGINITHKLKLK